MTEQTPFQKSLAEAALLGREVSWLIELAGPCYLQVVDRGGYYFQWHTDPHNAIRFSRKEDADLCMMAIREMRPELFPACLPVAPVVREHVFFNDIDTRRDYICCHTLILTCNQLL